jgi:hypothetical protein
MELFYDGLVVITIRYWLHGPGIESSWGRDFLYPFKTVLGPTQSSVECVPGLSRLGAVPGVWRLPPSPLIQSITIPLLFLWTSIVCG